MLHSEFNDRIGRKSTVEEYAYAHAIYMEFDGDKDVFCREYKKVASGKMFAAVCKVMHAMNDTIKTQQTRTKELTKQLELAETLAETIQQNAKADVEGMQADMEGMQADMSTFLIQTADRHCEDTETTGILRDKARAILGDRNFYATLLLEGCPDEKDMKAIAAMLAENK